MLGSITTPISCNSWSSIYFRGKSPNPVAPLRGISISSSLLAAAFPLHSALQIKALTPTVTHFSLKASSSSSSEYLEEPATNVKFPAYLTVPGRSSSLSLLGTGYREKTFAIIGVKVYAAGLYVDQSLFSALTSWKDQSSAEIEANSSLFGSILKAPSEKSLRIVLVRDVDGKTFWDALDGAISPRIKAPTEADKPALAKFRATFENGTLKKGAVIFLTWLDPCKMHVDAMSSDGSSSADATIESANVTAALFYVFFGDSPVSPSLKMSVATGLAAVLK
ncbi:Fatty-acid-binding protein 3, chloroplastic [Linum perenne]